MASSLVSEISAENDPFHGSLWGEYARILLVGHAACTGMAWLFRLSIDSAAPWMFAASLLMVAATTKDRLAGLPRLTLLSLLSCGIFFAIWSKQDPGAWWRPVPIFSPAVTVAALLVLVFRDGWIAMRKQAGAFSARKMVVLAFVLGAAIYMVILPSMEAVLELFREQPKSQVIEDMTIWEDLRFRSAKLAVFAIFAYAGACMGSFLNVVAASAPKGEPIALRSSACPKCGTPLRRLDNLPIYSYLRLRGRCRDCDAVIPVRYFVVELVGLAIFASLFLYELVTGGINIPGFKHYYYAGILWIILYAKWPLIGAYFYHCTLFSCVLMLALMEQDRLRAPRWMVVSLPLLFAGVAIGFPAMLTVSFGDQTPLQFPAKLPDWLDRAATSAAGGVVGLIVARLTRWVRLRQRQTNASLPMAFALIGLALGWQAVLTIALFWLMALNVLRLYGGRRLRPRWLTPTTLLFVIAMLHHPAWKWLAGHLSI